jgi:hypothetical protein
VIVALAINIAEQGARAKHNASATFVRGRALLGFASSAFFFFFLMTLGIQFLLEFDE